MIGICMFLRWIFNKAAESCYLIKLGILFPRLCLSGVNVSSTIQCVRKAALCTLIRGQGVLK